MATFLSGTTIGWYYYSNGWIYATLTGDVTRNGNTVTLSNMWLSLTCARSVSGSDNYTFTVNGTATSFRLVVQNPPSTNFGGYSLNSTSFSVGATQTSANVGWSSSDGYNGTFNVTFPAGVSPPTGLGANNIVRGVEEFTANVFISGWGVGSGTRYRELQCWTYDPNNLVTPRKYQPIYGDALSGNITVSNSSIGDLVIRGNTTYTLGVYASNGSASVGSNRVGDYTTLAYAPIVSASVSKTEAVITYELKADGGKYPRTYEYSIDSGTTWVQFDYVPDGSAKTGSFVLSGNFGSGPTTLKTRVRTDAGTTDAPDLVLYIVSNIGLLGSVNNLSRDVIKFCGSVNGMTKPIIKLYGSAGGVAKRIY